MCNEGEQGHLWRSDWPCRCARRVGELPMIPSRRRVSRDLTLTLFSALFHKLLHGFSFSWYTTSQGSTEASAAQSIASFVPFHAPLDAAWPSRASRHSCEFVQQTASLQRRHLVVMSLSVRWFGKRLRSAGRVCSGCAVRRTVYMLGRDGACCCAGEDGEGWASNKEESFTPVSNHRRAGS